MKLLYYIVQPSLKSLRNLIPPSSWWAVLVYSWKWHPKALWAPFSQPSPHQYSSYMSRSLLISKLFVWLTNWHHQLLILIGYLTPSKIWLSSRFGNFYEVIATDVFTKLFLKMRLLAKSLSWSQVLCGISVDSMWSLDCSNGEWGYARCLIFLCFFLARKFWSVQEVMSTFVQSLVSPLASACARENSFS